MLQRIQTVFLFLVGLCMLVFLFVPIWDKISASGDEAYYLKAFYLELVGGETVENQLVYSPYLFVGIAAILSVIVSFYEIFQYKNRITQIKLGALNAFLMAGVVVASFYFVTQGEVNWLPGEEGNYRLGLFLPIAALILNMIANRFIRRDEMLVRSTDRLR